MATKQPLVITNGQIEQLQAGDNLASADLFPRTNNNAGAIVIGQAVYVDGAGTVDLAQANAAGTKDVLGLVADVSIANAASGNIQSDGLLTATTGQWDAVTGQVGGLTAGSLYYLDPSTPGALTATAPTAVGQFVCPVGRAMSTTEMEITILITVRL